MCIRIDYLTNSKKALYCVRNAGVTPNTYETYEKLEDIPESIRHYVPKGGPYKITPDIAQFLGFGPDLFPEYENKCMYNGLRPMACVGPGCQKMETVIQRIALIGLKIRRKHDEKLYRSF